MQPFERLEQLFGETIENQNTVAVSSGTAALHLSMEVMRHFYGYYPGDRIVMPDFTMVACARAASMAGFSPIFQDCGSDLLTELTHNQVLQLPITTTGSIRAFMVVHIYGRQVEMQNVYEKLGEKFWVIEDLAEAHGVKPSPRTDAACWSFYKNKIVHGEEGGMIAFKEKAHALHAKKLRSLGFTDEHDFFHIPRGHNYRMSNLHAEPIIISLQSLKSNLRFRELIADRYDELIPQSWKMPTRTVDWVYDFRIPDLSRTNQTRIVNRLNLLKITARHAFKPLSSLPEYEPAWGLGSLRMLGETGDNAKKLSQEVIYLQINPSYLDFDMKKVIQVVEEVCSL